MKDKRLQQIFNKLEAMWQEPGSSEQTWGDTNLTTDGVVFGYNNALAELAEWLKKVNWSEKWQTIAALKTAKEEAYRERNQLVSFLARLYPSHFKQHPAEDKKWEDDWRTIVCIHSPAGQMTWHIHDSEHDLFGFLNVKPDPFPDCVWDGHTTPEKYYRLSNLPVYQEWHTGKSEANP